MAGSEAQAYARDGWWSTTSQAIRVSTALLALAPLARARAR